MVYVSANVTALSAIELYQRTQVLKHPSLLYTSISFSSQHHVQKSEQLSFNRHGSCRQLSIDHLQSVPVPLQYYCPGMWRVQYVQRTYYSDLIANWLCAVTYELYSISDSAKLLEQGITALQTGTSEDISLDQDVKDGLDILASLMIHVLQFLQGTPVRAIVISCVVRKIQSCSATRTLTSPTGFVVNHHHHIPLLRTPKQEPPSHEQAIHPCPTRAVDTACLDRCCCLFHSPSP